MKVLLRNHSHLSFLQAVSKPKEIAKKCAELGVEACALTDYGVLGGALEFSKACKKHGVKPILGIELPIICQDGRVVEMIFLAKNLEGWQNLVKLTSLANTEEHHSGQPALRLSDDNSEIQQYVPLSTTWCISLSSRHQEIVDTFKPGYHTKLALNNSHYINPEDKQDHQLLLASRLKTTLRKLEKDISKAGLYQEFFTDKDFSLCPEDLVFTDEQIATTQKLADACENYDITQGPMLPHFKWTDGKSEIEYLREICREGWAKKSKPNWDTKVYGDRVQAEFDVIEEADLSGYFLIVQDYVAWAKKRMLIGPGRGSAAGSLVAYLSSITEVDPIPHDLIFERFYNAGRNTKDRVSLPDIDVDFPIHQRASVIEYITEKYGKERVFHIVTFGRLMGAGALKEVLRMHEACDHHTSNAITKGIPDEAKIADKLQEDDETSVLRWILKNRPKTVEQYCTMDKEGNFHGDYARYFEQAIRLEGTYKSQGKHAAGLIISRDPVAEVCPVVFHKKGEYLAGMEMNDLEEMGLVKFDILGLLALDKLMGVNQLLRYGRIIDETK
jgi:DNA polymerase-3 subunit alpha